MHLVHGIEQRLHLERRTSHSGSDRHFEVMIEGLVLQASKPLRFRIGNAHVDILPARGWMTQYSRLTSKYPNTPGHVAKLLGR
jgi:hypothetical protein